MIFIRYRNSLHDINAQPVELIHHQPQQLTPEELRLGTLVESIPEKPDTDPGKKLILLFNPAESKLWWQAVGTENSPPTRLQTAGAGEQREAKRQQDPFIPGRADGVFALAAFVLGFLFIRWVFFYWEGYGVALFTLLYCGIVLAYLRQKGIRPPRYSCFWLAILLLTGLSYALWQGNGLQPWRQLLLFGTALYWTVTAADMTLLGKTSDWLPLDGLQALLFIPWRNFGGQYRSLHTLRQRRPGERNSQSWSVALGILLALVAVSAVLPLLVEADSGGFARMTSGIVSHLNRLWFGSVDWLVQLLLAMPTAAYIFALVAGSAHRRGLPNLTQNAGEQGIQKLRILPASTVSIVLGALAGLYLVFIGSQLPYFFSAFAGQRPEGWLLYSEYARRGFFELCGIAAINLSVLAAANLGSRQPRQQSKLLKGLNLLLAALTLVLIATAFSKMALYIGAYGLSVRRLLPCVLMILLAAVCLGVIWLQWRQFSIMRLAAVLGAALFCAVCLIDPDARVARYNAQRYLAGTLDGFDADILYRAGPAGVDAALMVYEQTSDRELKRQLEQYLEAQRYQSAGKGGTTRDTLQNAAVRRR